MEEKMIVVSFRKSNRSNFIVCQVSISNETENMQYCTSPLKAMRYMFLLKQKTGISIERASLEALKALHAYVRDNASETVKEAAA